jgi:hypothetical protein
MSDESYRILDDEEINKYIDCTWFREECKYIPNVGWTVPEKYLKRDIDKKEFFHNKLKELLEGFNFDDVHKCMDTLDWTWAGVTGIPEKEDMIPVIQGLYKSIEPYILNEKYGFCATGGFKLEFIPDNELRLTFEAVSFSVDDN